MSWYRILDRSNAFWSSARSTTESILRLGAWKLDNGACLMRKVSETTMSEQRRGNFLRISGRPSAATRPGGGFANLAAENGTAACVSMDTQHGRR